MTSFKDNIVQKLVQCTPPDGIIYYYEISAYKSGLKKCTVATHKAHSIIFFTLFLLEKKNFLKSF